MLLLSEGNQALTINFEDILNVRPMGFSAVGNKILGQRITDLNALHFVGPCDISGPLNDKPNNIWSRCVQNELNTAFVVSFE